MPRSDFWSGLVVAGFGVLALVWMIPGYAGVNPFAQMPPSLVPSIGAWIMVICGGIVSLGALARMIAARQYPITREINWAAVGWAVWPFVYVALAIWVMMHVKITWVGGFFIAGMLVLLGERRLWLIVLCSAAPVGLLYILSVYLMRVGVV